MDKEQDLRREIIHTCLEMNRLGINQGTSGNVSARWDKGMLITPSGIVYESLEPKDIIYFSFGNNRAKGPHKPSSEWRFHRDILKTYDHAMAVVHTHSVFATAMAIQKRAIPAHHYMVAAAGGKDIRCAPYATFGTAALSKAVVAALEDRLACLLAHHGVVATGPDLSKALWLANEVEILAKQYTVAAQLGEVPVLPDKEMARIVEAFKSYGPKSRK